MKPRLLDLCSGEGGAARGYDRAGFDVTCVDLYPQPVNPYPFIQADAFDYARVHIMEYDAVHISPPCQAHSLLQAVNGYAHLHPRLIEPARDLFDTATIPYVIENVVGATLFNPLRLCGEMFGLGVIRHRLFETNWEIDEPYHVPHRGKVRGWRHGEYFDGPYVAVYGEGGGKGTTAEWSSAMDIDWMTRDGLREAIPPAYTEYVGRALMAVVRPA